MATTITADYGISYRDRDKKYRSGFGIEFRKGFEVYHIASGQTVAHGITTEEDAIEQAHAMQTRADAKAAEKTTPATAPKATATGRVMVDQQALAVGQITGLGAPKADGRCHYCGQRLNRRGYCEECV